MFDLALYELLCPTYKEYDELMKELYKKAEIQKKIKKSKTINNNYDNQRPNKRVLR